MFRHWPSDQYDHGKFWHDARLPPLTGVIRSHPVEVVDDRGDALADLVVCLELGERDLIVRPLGDGDLDFEVLFSFSVGTSLI